MFQSPAINHVLVFAISILLAPLCVDDLAPKEKCSQDLLAKWQQHARADGTVPGGALQDLVTAAERFVKNNPTSKHSPALKELLPRIDTSREWRIKELVELLDDVTEAYRTLPRWALDHHRFFGRSETVRDGEQIPKSLLEASWGKETEDGLRLAWHLEPSQKEYHLMTPLKSRILFHNNGGKTIVFQALNWNQSGGYEARDSDGDVIKVESFDRMGTRHVIVCRLRPNEFCEVVGEGVGIGAREDQEDWRGTQVSTWIHAMETEQITFSPGFVLLNGEPDPDWWRGFVRSKLELETPFPVDGAERSRLLNRVTKDLLGEPASEKEVAAFVADEGPDVLDNVVRRLASRPNITAFVGRHLKSGDIEFRVIDVDPEKEKQPRIATGPGTYQLNNFTKLAISRRRVEGKKVYEGHLEFENRQGKIELELAEGFRIAWKRTTSDHMWLVSNGRVKLFKFAEKRPMKRNVIDPTALDEIPENYREAWFS